MSKLNQTCIYTICTISFLPKALVLSESVYYYERKKVIIYIIDKKCEVNINYEFAELRWIEDENILNFNNLAFTYNVTEFCTLFKPLLGLRLLSLHSSIIYLDPDICLYNSLDCIYDKLRNFPIILTPHYTKPRQDNLDMGMMRFGSFNLGFYAVTSNPEAIEFLRWWSDRCLNLGFYEPQFGLSTDQKWVSIAPCFFPNIHIEFNLGLNVAYWNLHERTLIKTSKNYFVNNQYPLVFFHFSSFDINNPLAISPRFQNISINGREALNEVCLEYKSKLLKFDKNLSKVKYSYDYMSDGSYISSTLRLAYSAVLNELPKDTDPFDSSGCMKKFISKNFLKEKKNKTFIIYGYNELPGHYKKFMLINYFLRQILRIMGPSKFYNLSRLFVYLSSFRQNRSLWKIDNN